MKRHIDQELQGLKDKILHMGSLAEEMVRLSSKTFVDRSSESSPRIFELESQVNQMQLQIDEESVRILALYQPEATDLRTIISTVKMNSELERIADQAINITQTCCNYLLKETPLPSTMEIPRMSELAQEMIKISLDAYSPKNVEMAQIVLQKDQEQDILKSRLLNTVISMIPHHASQAQQFIDFILISKNLEKIGDHATNIAEDVIYMVLGKDIRHPSRNVVQS